MLSLLGTQQTQRGQPWVKNRGPERGAEGGERGPPCASTLVRRLFGVAGLCRGSFSKSEQRKTSFFCEDFSLQNWSTGGSVDAPPGTEDFFFFC